MGWQDVIGSVLTAGATGDPMAFSRNKLEQAFKQFQMQKMTDELEMQREMHGMEKQKLDILLKQKQREEELENHPVSGILAALGHKVPEGAENVTVGQAKYAAPIADIFRKQEKKPLAIGGKGVYEEGEFKEAPWADKEEPKAPTKISYPQGNQEITEIYENGKLSRTITAPRTTGGSGTSKPPSGYRWNGEELEPIPGGPADWKLQDAMSKDKFTLDGMVDKLTRLKTTAERVRKHPGLSRTTGAMSVLPNVPGGDAATAKALLEGTLKSQIGFNVLQDMRSGSKSGGALGQVSERENILLQENIDALDLKQDTKTIQENLKKIETYADEAIER
jgi:hypothetical protein